MTSIEYYFSLIARLSYFVVYNIQTDEQTEELKIQCTVPELFVYPFHKQQITLFSGLF